MALTQPINHNDILLREHIEKLVFLSISFCVVFVMLIGVFTYMTEQSISNGKVLGVKNSTKPAITNAAAKVYIAICNNGDYDKEYVYANVCINSRGIKAWL